jgi:hypothetical protein
MFTFLLLPLIVAACACILDDLEMRVGELRVSLSSAFDEKTRARSLLLFLSVIALFLFMKEFFASKKVSVSEFIAKSSKNESIKKTH